VKNDNIKSTKRFSLYTPPDLLEKLKTVAIKNHRSINGEMLHAIEKHLEQETLASQ
jgi:hypothetical protein